VIAPALPLPPSILTSWTCLYCAFYSSAASTVNDLKSGGAGESGQDPAAIPSRTAFPPSAGGDPTPAPAVPSGPLSVRPSLLPPLPASRLTALPPPPLSSPIRAGLAPSTLHPTSTSQPTPLNSGTPAARPLPSLSSALLPLPPKPASEAQPLTAQPPPAKSHPAPAPDPLPASEADSLRAVWQETRDQLHKCRELLRRKQTEYTETLSRREAEWERRAADTAAAHKAESNATETELQTLRAALAAERGRGLQAQSDAAEDLARQLGECRAENEGLVRASRALDDQLTELRTAAAASAEESALLVRTLEGTVARQAALVAELSGSGGAAGGSEGKRGGMASAGAVGEEGVGSAGARLAAEEVRQLREQVERLERDLADAVQAARDARAAAAAAEAAQASAEEESRRCMGEISQLLEAVAVARADAEALRAAEQRLRRGHEVALAEAAEAAAGSRKRAAAAEAERAQLRDSLSRTQVELAGANATIAQQQRQQQLQQQQQQQQLQQQQQQQGLRQSAGPYGGGPALTLFPGSDLKSQALAEEVLQSRASIEDLTARVRRAGEETAALREQVRDRDRVNRILEDRLRAELGDDYDSEVASMLIKGIAAVRVPQQTASSGSSGSGGFGGRQGPQDRRLADLEEGAGGEDAWRAGGGASVISRPSSRAPAEGAVVRGSRGAFFGVEADADAFADASPSQSSSLEQSAGWLRGKRVRDVLRIDSMRAPESKFRSAVARLLAPCARFVDVPRATERLAAGAESAADAVDGFSHSISKRLRHNAGVRLAFMLYVLFLHAMIIYIVWHFTHHNACEPSAGKHLARAPCPPPPVPVTGYEAGYNPLTNTG
jgi:hypothetical protein